MSSDAAAVVDLFSSIYTGNYCAIAASGAFTPLQAPRWQPHELLVSPIALFFFDALVVTFAREVACFWTAKRTGGSLLFFANMWISMVLYIMGLVEFASFHSDESRTVIIISRVPLIVADILLIYITWTKLGSRVHTRLSLSDILLRDGIKYFVVLFILNVLHLVLSVTAVAGDLEGSYVTEFTAPITAILISRFLLELQEANQMAVQLDHGGSSRDPYDTPSFISSLGGFINPDPPASSDDDDFELYTGSFSGAGKEEGESHQAATSSSSA
ncbi:hypothetical protein OH76DRAFT_1479520 [Lentinus brumalis]|uniref:Transmembrane protein n=1 Tax=Lentinus brumalis TaxID=2498619 RepID=A0A371DMI4_9APHY|nr:hypothetical protein OH76DRAFT_1479520 [Polyporus brumalis]